MLQSKASLILFGFISALSFQASAALISTNAGRVADMMLTTREVMMTHMIEIALYKQDASAALASLKLRADRVHERDFVRETTSALIETAIFFEADSFTSNSQVDDKAIRKLVKTAEAKLNKNKVWLELEPEPQEVFELVRRKARAKEFIKFKMDSGTIPITDKEAEDYFSNNRLKFENLPFDSFKDNIKNYLTKQQVDRRIKDWFELLQAKYRVRNYLLD